MSGTTEDTEHTERSRDERGNPFRYRMTTSGNEVEACDVASRLGMVRRMTVEQLRAVFYVPGVQKTVKRAAERRLRKLTIASGWVDRAESTDHEQRTTDP